MAALVDINYAGDIFYYQYIRCLGMEHFTCFDISHKQSILQSLTSPALYIWLYQNLSLVSLIPVTLIILICQPKLVLI